MKINEKDLELSHCVRKYWDFVRELRNNSKVSGGFIKSKFITEKEQIEYMKCHSKNYRIALVNGNPAGYIGVINNDIRVCTHPNYQGKGVGRFLVFNCKKIWPNSKALIKIDNEASLKLFESCGFSKKYFLLEQNNSCK